MATHYQSTCDSCVLQGITHHFDCYNGFHLCGLGSTGSAWCCSATTVDTKGHNGGFCWPCHCSTTATTSAFSGIYHLCHESYQVSFLFQSWSFHWCIMLYVSACNGVCFLFWGYHVAAIFTNEGSTVGICSAAALWSILLAGMCAYWWWSVAHTRSALGGWSFHCIEWGKLHATHSAVSSAIPFIWLGIQLWGLGRATQSLCLSYTVVRGLVFHPMTQLQICGWC